MTELVVGFYDGEELVQGPMFTVVRCSSKGACSLLHEDVVDKVIFGVEVLVSHDKVSAYSEGCMCMCCVFYMVYIVSDVYLFSVSYSPSDALTRIRCKHVKSRLKASDGSLLESEKRNMY